MSLEEEMERIRPWLKEESRGGNIGAPEPAGAETSGAREADQASTGREAIETPVGACPPEVPAETPTGIVAMEVSVEDDPVGGAAGGSTGIAAIETPVGGTPAEPEVAAVPMEVGTEVAPAVAEVAGSTLGFPSEEPIECDSDRAQQELSALLQQHAPMGGNGGDPRDRPWHERVVPVERSRPADRLAWDNHPSADPTRISGPLVTAMTNLVARGKVGKRVAALILGEEAAEAAKERVASRRVRFATTPERHTPPPPHQPVDWSARTPVQRPQRPLTVAFTPAVPSERTVVPIGLPTASRASRGAFPPAGYASDEEAPAETSRRRRKRKAGKMPDFARDVEFWCDDGGARARLQSRPVSGPPEPPRREPSRRAARPRRPEQRLQRAREAEPRPASRRDMRAAAIPAPRPRAADPEGPAGRWPPGMLRDLAGPGASRIRPTDQPAPLRRGWSETPRGTTPAARPRTRDVRPAANRPPVATAGEAGRQHPALASVSAPPPPWRKERGPDGFMYKIYPDGRRVRNTRGGSRLTQSRARRAAEAAAAAAGAANTTTIAAPATPAAATTPATTTTAAVAVVTAAEPAMAPPTPVPAPRTRVPVAAEVALSADVLGLLRAVLAILPEDQRRQVIGDAAGGPSGGVAPNPGGQDHAGR